MSAPFFGPMFIIVDYREQNLEGSCGGKLEGMLDVSISQGKHVRLHGTDVFRASYAASGGTLYDKLTKAQRKLARNMILKPRTGTQSFKLDSAEANVSMDIHFRRPGKSKLNRMIILGK